MLSLRIAAIGRERGTPMAALTESYLARAQDLSRGLGFSGPDLKVVDAPRGGADEQRQKREATLLCDSALQGGEAIILDERGKAFSSQAFARYLEARRDGGIPALTFFIGGADGHHPDLAASLSPRPVRTLSFGEATWPHQLVRVMLAEQLYRALTILAGHPYHRD